MTMYTLRDIDLTETQLVDRIDVSITENSVMFIHTQQFKGTDSSITLYLNIQEAKELLDALEEKINR